MAIKKRKPGRPPSKKPPLKVKVKEEENKEVETEQQTTTESFDSSLFDLIKSERAVALEIAQKGLDVQFAICERLETISKALSLMTLRTQNESGVSKENYEKLHGAYTALYKEHEALKYQYNQLYSAYNALAPTRQTVNY